MLAPTLYRNVATTPHKVKLFQLCNHVESCGRRSSKRRRQSLGTVPRRGSLSHQMQITCNDSTYAANHNMRLYRTSGAAPRSSPPSRCSVACSASPGTRMQHSTDSGAGTSRGCCGPISCASTRTIWMRKRPRCNGCASSARSARNVCSGWERWTMLSRPPVLLTCSACTRSGCSI